jgi:hypothetical protein
MKNSTITENPQKVKKPMGRFRNMDEALEYKLKIFNKVFGKLDPKVFENIGK